jgi:hypothetical protein
VGTSYHLSRGVCGLCGTAVCACKVYWTWSNTQGRGTCSGGRRSFSAGRGQTGAETGFGEVALTWLDAPRRRFEDEDDTGIGVDLRIAALEALGRREDAQAVRWRHFERALSAEHLRAYLRRLPDFEDFEAEQRALDIAASHRLAALAVGFFIEWRVLDRAERLVRDRLAALDGRLYEVLRPAAEALEEKFPTAASLLYRRMIESVLDRGASKQYPYAARDFASCARLAPRLPASETIESHATFVARLRKVHGRKYGFWGQFDRKG